MEKYLKNRTFVGLLCIVISFVMIFFINNNKNKDEITTVVIATKNINKGEKITEEMLKKVELMKYNLPSNLPQNLENVVDKYATKEISENDFISENKITLQPIASSKYFSNLNGKQAISVSIKSLAKGLSGQIESGDIVSIIVPSEDTDDIYSAENLNELKYVEVISVNDKDGYDSSNSKDNNDKKVSSTVTLLVNETQAKILAELEENNSIHLSLVYRNDDDKKEEFLQIQDKYFEEN